MDITYSKHADTRKQQRAIPQLIIDWLMDYGASIHTGDGDEIRYFDKISRKRITSVAGEQVVKKLSELLNTYLVMHGNCIITVGYRDKHLLR